MKNGSNKNAIGKTSTGTFIGNIVLLHFPDTQFNYVIQYLFIFYFIIFKYKVYTCMFMYIHVQYIYTYIIPKIVGDVIEFMNQDIIVFV